MKYTWQSLNKLLSYYEGAAYILDIEKFRSNADYFLSAFRQHYPNTKLGYSYKTNYLPRLCIEADHLGMYAEVVSGMEYEIAIACGIDESRIIFNGPVKSRAELKRAFIGGALVNIDSLGEAALVAEVARTIDKHIRIGLRCNLDLQWKGRTSRFGLSYINEDLTLAKKILSDVPNIVLAGIHCHSSFDRSADSYRLRTEMMKEIALALFTDSPPQFIDIGGGFCGQMPESLKAQFSLQPPDAEEYAMAISDVLLKGYGSDNPPELILEPGVGLVGNVFDYVCRIEQVKSMTDRHVAVTAGTTMDIKIVPNDYNPPLELLRCPENGITTKIPVDFVGFTCLEHDLIYHSYENSVTAGDIAVFGSTGAYSMVTASTFIRTTPPVVTPLSTGEWQVLKSKLNVSQLMSQFSW